MKATTMTDKVMAHFCAEETCPSAPGGVTLVTSPGRFALERAEPAPGPAPFIAEAPARR
jgi:hypothetical protein